jgi:hypothetical protein
MGRAGCRIDAFMGEQAQTSQTTFSRGCDYGAHLVLEFEVGEGLLGTSLGFACDGVTERGGLGSDFGRSRFELVEEGHGGLRGVRVLGAGS